MRAPKIFAYSLAAVAFVASVAVADPVERDDGVRVIQVSTREGETVHQRLNLPLDKAVVVELDSDARDVLVSNPNIVDAVVRTPRRVFLLATKTGQTNAFFFDGKGRQLLSADIRVEKDVADLSGLIRSNMPGSNVKVAALNDNVVLSGAVSSQLQSTRAQDLAARFAGDPNKVVNLLSVAGGEQVMLKVRVAEMQRQIAKQFGVNVSGVANAYGLPIVASTSNPFGLLGHALSDLSGAQVGEVCKVTQLLSPLVSIPPAGSPPASVFPGETSNFAGITPGTINTAGTSLGFSPNTLCQAQPNNVQGVMQALEQVGLVHILAEPNLTAVSGETAKFLAGGEFPVPAGRDLQGNVTIEFKQFGVGLAFTPVVMSPGRISLQISTEVSELTNTGALTLQGGQTTTSTGQVVTINGLTVPALNVRRAETTVELPSGGSFAIAGLMQHTTKQVLDAFPGLKDMPVLGALFRSRDFENDETELVVLVSAYLVSPTTEAKLAVPTQGFKPPTDIETIFGGKLNAVSDKKADEKKSEGKASSPLAQSNSYIVQ
jgi:pilus assembly protein CpaC